MCQCFRTGLDAFLREAGSTDHAHCFVLSRQALNAAMPKVRLLAELLNQAEDPMMPVFLPSLPSRRHLRPPRLQPPHASHPARRCCLLMLHPCGYVQCPTPSDPELHVHTRPRARGHPLRPHTCAHEAHGRTRLDGPEHRSPRGFAAVQPCFGRSDEVGRLDLTERFGL